MATLKDQDLLDVYYEINNKSDENNAFNNIRKTTVLKHTVALNTLDNRSACLLLNEDLKKHSTTTLINDKNMSTMMSRNHCRQFGLQKSFAISQIANLGCSGKPVCEKSENISEEQFQEFLSLFQGKRNRSVVTEQKQRTLMKSYVKPVINVKEDAQSDTNKVSSFKTAREDMNFQTKQAPNASGQKRKLGTRRGVTSKFVSPLLSNESNEDSTSKSQEWEDQIEDDRLKNLEPRMIELIKSEIMDKGPPVDWNDIAGLEFAKTAIQEAVVWPMLRPDIFTGLRRPPKGILLFGPPGTGKTLIGKCVASQSKSTFFSISASSLTSKWVGEGEKMVRALFAVARCQQPAVIFIDEIDSLLSQRSDTEHESSRRIKTEFLVQLDGATTDNDEKLLVIGATNRPQELDEAARRRFVKRLYIPLPELRARQELIERLMLKENHQLNTDDIMEIAQLSEGYSGADMRNLCADASMGPIRSLDMNLIHSIQTAEVRPINMNDCRLALSRVKSSVSSNDLDQYIVWNKTYGSGSLC